jgi:exodeoxyribonuclease VII small subunit
MAADLFGDSEEHTMAGDDRAKSDAKPSKSKPPPEAPRFEEAFSRLEEVIDEMERGELPLEDLLVRFEEGVELVKRCRGFLKQAQTRIERFVEVKDGQWVLKEMEDGS